jgi:hypothetical protein
VDRRDLSGDVPPEREAIRREQPDVPFWSENLLFAPYDPGTGAALWLHLGTVPNDWSMWHEMNYAMLPGGEGVLSMWSFHRTAAERRPAGSNLRFECLEPFRRWHLSFDGYGLHTSLDAMQEGFARLGPVRRWSVDLEVEGITPLWDYHTGATAESGHGGMEDQGWAKDHYEQMYRARGTVRFGDDELPFDGYGWRDHSSGPRGSGAGAPWGGHVTAGAVYAGGRGWGATRFWAPDGTINLEAGWVCDERGRMHHAEVIDAAQLTELILAGEELPFVLRWEGGTLELSVTVARTLWLGMGMGLPVGRNAQGVGQMFVPSWGSAKWDGEDGVVYVERSNPLNSLPKDLRHG